MTCRILLSSFTHVSTVLNLNHHTGNCAWVHWISSEYTVARGIERHENMIVLIGAAGGLPFWDQDSDDNEWHLVYANDFSDWMILRRKQLLGNGLSKHYALARGP